MGRSFDELVKDLMAVSDDEEKNRIQEEAEYIRKNNAKEQFLFLSNVVPALSLFFTFLKGDAQDSYLLRKALEPMKKNSAALALPFTLHKGLILNVAILDEKYFLEENLSLLHSVINDNKGEMTVEETEKEPEAGYLYQSIVTLESNGTKVEVNISAREGW